MNLSKLKFFDCSDERKWKQKYNFEKLKLKEHIKTWIQQIKWGLQFHFTFTKNI